MADTTFYCFSLKTYSILGGYLDYLQKIVYYLGYTNELGSRAGDLGYLANSSQSSSSGFSEKNLLVDPDLQHFT
jgi:hypothetical protein